MSGIYGNLTKYIGMFKNDNFGEWSQAEQSVNNTIIAPHVHYTQTAHNFIKDIYDYIDDEELDTIQTSYNNIKKTINNHEINIDKASGDEIIYYLLWMINNERFCDGLLLDYYKDGTILMCLKRLTDIDDINKKKYGMLN